METALRSNRHLPDMFRSKTGILLEKATALGSGRRKSRPGMDWVRDRVTVLKAGRWIVVRMSQTDNAMDDGTDADWLSVRLDGPRGTGSTVDGDDMERRVANKRADAKESQKDEVDRKAALDFHVEALETKRKVAHTPHPVAFSLMVRPFYQKSSAMSRRGEEAMTCDGQDRHHAMD
ncbi:unnamed protein product [Fusarium graminearum]|uniref:Uncharacterized protein n=1 Tax=Gibberella zeae TaxID=5518 RepID=A0A4E9EQ88_GIBZA|nr:unnamed protein product [Fusarium graminearum]CAF3631783.1 unnamed protein product [Fusarium graminearum]CAG1985381.1 unnamed protein product [Fusarium graminearum]CAG1987759.1 unnamed protein product [Fusarium graminearum]